MSGYVHILASKPRGTLYVGVTADLVARGAQRRAGDVPGFTRQYRVHQLVHFEEHATMPLAIRREKNLKRWLRKWKIDLIENNNPEWRDLYSELSR